MEKFEVQRGRSNINREELTSFIYGGPIRRKMVQKVLDLLSRCNAQNERCIDELSREELFEYLLKMSTEVFWPAFMREFPDFDHDSYPDEIFASLPYMSAGGIGFLMASKVIEMMGTPEQAAKYLPYLKSYTIMASYSQTELSVGSDVQSIKTLATFDKGTQEFVLHTPSIEGIKWWPGDLGVHSTHTLVFARMIIDDADYGI